MYLQQLRQVIYILELMTFIKEWWLFIALIGGLILAIFKSVQVLEQSLSEVKYELRNLTKHLKRIDLDKKMIVKRLDKKQEQINNLNLITNLHNEKINTLERRLNKID